MGTIIDGRLFKQMYPGPYIKVYGEKEHIPRSQTGILIDTDLKSEYQIRKLTFTNLENIKKYFDEVKGIVYICRLEIPDGANVFVKSNNFFRTNMCVVQNICNIWQSGIDITNYVIENIKIRSIEVIPKKYLTLEIIMKYIGNNNFDISEVPKKYLTPEIIMKCLECNNIDLNVVPKKCFTPEIIMKYIEYNDFSISKIPKKYLTNEIFGKYLKNKKRSCFTRIPHNIVTYDMVMTKFCFHTDCLSNISKNHKTYDFYKKYIKKQGTLEYVPKKFRDSDMCILAIDRCWWAIEDAAKNTLKHIPINVITEEVCKKIIDFDIRAINHIPKEKITENVAMYHFTKYGINSLPLKYRTIDIYEIAISNNIKNIRYLPSEFLSYEYVHELAQINCHVLGYCNRGALYKFNRKELYMTAYNNDPMAIIYFPYNMLNYELMENAMRVKGVEIMEYVSLNDDGDHDYNFIRYMKKYSKLYMVAYENNPKAIVYFPDRLLGTKIIENAMTTNGYDILEYLQSIKSVYKKRRDRDIPFYKFLCSNANLYKYAYKNNNESIQFIPKKYHSYVMS